MHLLDKHSESEVQFLLEQRFKSISLEEQVSDMYVTFTPSLFGIITVPKSI